MTSITCEDLSSPGPIRLTHPGPRPGSGPLGEASLSKSAVLPLVAAGVLSAIAGWLGHAASTRRSLNAARCDPVTGLLGRAAIDVKASRMVRGREARTVGLIDLDRFKHVNDTYGHAAGDQLLAATGARMRSWADRVGGAACGRLSAATSSPSSPAAVSPRAKPRNSPR